MGIGQAKQLHWTVLLLVGMSSVFAAGVSEWELVGVLSGLETTCWASDPDPANGAADVNLRDRVLTWRPGSVTCELGDFVEHRVWFGPADTGLVDQGGTMVPEFAPGNLLPQEYIWRVDEVYTGGTQQGTEWHFTVRELSCQDVIDAGLLLSADLSGPLGVPDCHVNLYDLAAFVGQWLECNDPSDDTCLFPF